MIFCVLSIRRQNESSLFFPNLSICKCTDSTKYQHSFWIFFSSFPIPFLSERSWFSLPSVYYFCFADFSAKQKPPVYHRQTYDNRGLFIHLFSFFPLLPRHGKCLVSSNAANRFAPLRFYEARKTRRVLCSNALHQISKKPHK